MDDDFEVIGIDGKPKEADGPKQAQTDQNQKKEAAVVDEDDLYTEVKYDASKPKKEADGPQQATKKQEEAKVPEEEEDPYGEGEVVQGDQADVEAM